MKDEAYDKNYRFENDYWWFRVRNRIVLETIRRYTRGRDMAVLDYGCGTGRMLELMAEFGDVRGCDASERALDYCRARGLERLFTPEPDCSNLGDCDLITLLDVLEHADDDAALLRSLASHLNPGGRIIITVPALPCLWSGEDYVSEHKRRYVKARLLDTVRSAGLRPLRATYFNTLLLPLIYFHIKINNTLNPESRKHSNLSALPGPVNMILSWIFGIENTLLRAVNLPAGMSLLCVAARGDGK